MKKYKYKVKCKICDKEKIVKRYGATPMRHLVPPNWKFVNGFQYICDDH